MQVKHYHYYYLLLLLLLFIYSFNFDLESQRESGSDYMDAGNDYAMNGEDDDTIILELEK